MSARDKSAPDIPLLEWLAAAAGAAITIGSIAFLAYRGWTDEDTPPDIRIEASAVVPLRHGYLVQIRATNVGSRTAAGVRVRGQLFSGNALVETSEAGFDYLPSQGSRRGGVYFTNDPSAHTIRLKAIGYEDP